MGAANAKSEAVQMCPVCFESSPPPDFERVCGHKFHTACHLKWCERNVTCPLCRDEFVMHVTRRRNEGLKSIVPALWDAVRVWH